MNWLVGIGLFALVGICSYFGIEHHLDSKANKLSQGNEEDRRDAAPFRGADVVVSRDLLPFRGTDAQVEAA
ncbi:MAG: hypothetical protein KHX19_08415 [Bifidobacterium longum]|nr:hypothetical protein [Bifidobacterium longum]